MGGPIGKEERQRVGTRGMGALGNAILLEGVQKYVHVGASIAVHKFMVGLWCTAATRKANSSQKFLLLPVYGAPLGML